MAWLAGFGFSNLADDLPSAQLFAMPPPSLRTNSTPVVKPPTVATNAVEIVLTSETSNEAAVQRFEALSGGPVLRPPPPRDDPAGAYGFVKNALAPITDLESVKVGKAHITGGLVNAVKQKNPLCLLHPLVFAVDW